MALKQIDIKSNNNNQDLNFLSKLYNLLILCLKSYSRGLKSQKVFQNCVLVVSEFS